MNYSLTYVGVLVSLIGTLARWFNWHVPWTDSDDLAQFLQGIVTLVGLTIALYGRWRRGDISALGVKK